MFSLIVVVCQGFVCVSFTPSEVYTTETACMEYALVLYQTVQDTPEREIIDMDCYEWHDQA